MISEAKYTTATTKRPLHLKRVPLNRHQNRENIRPNKRKAIPNPKVEAVKNSIAKIKTWKVIVGIIISLAIGFVYVTHVFATQKLLKEVQTLEADFNKSRTKHDLLKLRYDRMIGPSDIYKKAEAAGFVNRGPADKIITIKE